MASAESDRLLVLFTEDDPIVRLTASLGLEEEGLCVLTASHAAEALAVLAEHGHEVDVLITDIEMPGGMNGIELAHRVAAEWPGIGRLIISGRGTPDPASLPADTPFLLKPIRHRTVARQVRALAQRP